MMTIAQIRALVDSELRHGDRRSSEYVLGMSDLLAFKLIGTPIPLRYQPGSASFDAYGAGNSRGWALYHCLAG